MSPANAVRATSLRISMEVAAVFLACLLLAGLRVLSDEPANPFREERERAREAAAQGRRATLGALPQRSPGLEPAQVYDRPADEKDYYLPVIREMEARWPRIDLARDTRVEKPPGYPFLMATVARAAGMEVARLRVFHLLLSACMPALLYLWLRRGHLPLAAAALLAPLLCSSFLAKSAAYLGTDAPALLCTTLALMLLVRERATTGQLVAVLVAATAAASFRQDSLWLAAPITLRLLLSGPWAGWRAGPEAAQAPPGHRVLLLGAVLLPAALVGRMVAEWGGLVPHAHVRSVEEPGASFMPVVYLLGVAALFLWPWALARHGLAGAWRRACERPALLAGLAGLALALATDSRYGRELGHWGGYLWSLAAALPEWGERSPVFLALAPLGALALGLVGAELAREQPRAAAVLGAALGCWAAACCFNSLVFHRYYEVPLLTFLLLASGLLSPPLPRAGPLRDRLPLLLVGAAQLLITIATLYLSLFAPLRR